jgi:hypothetical protein
MSFNKDTFVRTLDRVMRSVEGVVKQVHELQGARP